jgi:UDP-N-acetylglucosamine 2-epimerase (non-hydrolysing)
MAKKVSVIFGTRPEAIKLAPVILALKKDSFFKCHVCVTAQHREMLDSTLRIFSIAPDADLNLMRRNQSLAGLTSRAIKALDDYLCRENPDLVLVQGDTTTVFCATLAAFYRRIPVGHVEAGLRTWNLNAPWPEEANRVLTARLAALHFAPTKRSCANLLREGVLPERVCITGNTIVDALLEALKAINNHEPHIKGLPHFLQPSVRHGDTKMVLITGHRRESFGEGFGNICHAISKLSQRLPEVHFVYPVHLNPNVREPVHRILRRRPLGRGRVLHQNIHLIEPLAYLPFVALMKRSSIILTDSGGVQEEAPSIGKPVLVMRDTTERPEGIEAGAVKLVGTKSKRIEAEVYRLLSDPAAYKAMLHIKNPYGDGKAAVRIVARCRSLFAKGR